MSRGLVEVGNGPLLNILCTDVGPHSPQHSVTNIKCRHFIFQICHVIAQNSDPGREALINDGVLPVLMRLANDHIGANVIHSCIILNGLAHTGTYRNQLVTAGVKDAMQQITR